MVDHPDLRIQDHIKLLDMHAINSEFPGLNTFTDQQPIFHIAGESNFIRGHILSHAWQNLCHYYENQDADEVEDDHKALPLLVTKKWIDNIDYVSLHEQEWKKINSDLEDIQSIPSDEHHIDQWSSTLPKVRILNIL